MPIETDGWLAGTPLSRVRRRGPQTSTHRTLDRMSFGSYNLNDQPGADSIILIDLCQRILSIQILSNCTIIINKSLAKVFLMDGSSAGWLCEMIRASWDHNIQSGKSREVTPPLQPFTYTRNTTLHNSDQRCQLLVRRACSSKSHQPAVTTGPAGTKLSCSQKSPSHP